MQTTAKRPTLSGLVNSTNIPESLVRAVVRQMGGWESFKESAPDICRGGIDGGFHGFIYYSDTLPFAKRNRKAILELASQQANDFGQGLVEMIQGFNCLKSIKPSQAEVVDALSGNIDKAGTQVPNALAWYAGEEVARAYCDAFESDS